MTTATATAVMTDTPASEAPATPVWRIGAISGVVAAVATTIIAAVAMGADVPMEVDGEQIPVLAYPELTLVGAAIGIVLAKALTRWAAKPQRTFVATTIALTGLSIVPDLTFPMTTATSAVLITLHLAAAAIIIPALASRLPRHTR